MELPLEEIENILKGGPPFTLLDNDPEQHRSLCTDRRFLATLAERLREKRAHERAPDEGLDAGSVRPDWVDFILNSANTWRRPIEDFILIVEDTGSIMPPAFCPPRHAQKENIGGGRYQVHLKNFVPKEELHIAFF